MKYQAAFLALVALITVSLHANPVIIETGGDRLEVNGVDEENALFTCRAVDRVGQTVQGGPTTLPFERQYCDLILPRIKWAETERAAAAGAGNNT
jgi:hypothetical protein